MLSRLSLYTPSGNLVELKPEKIVHFMQSDDHVVAFVILDNYDKYVPHWLIVLFV